MLSTISHKLGRSKHSDITLNSLDEKSSTTIKRKKDPSRIFECKNIFDKKKSTQTKEDIKRVKKRI
jgi:hypothetical protein